MQSVDQRVSPLILVVYSSVIDKLIIDRFDQLDLAFSILECLPASDEE